MVSAAQHENVHVVFVHGDSGDWWPKEIGGRDPLPDVEALEKIACPEMMKKKLFGVRPFFVDKVSPTGKEIAIASWSNHWQMLDVALMLRGLGHAAAKVFYSGCEELILAGRGVEENIRAAMKLKFGVVLNWSAAPA